MDTLLGEMNTINTVPHPSTSRKRKSSPPPKYRSNDHRSSPIDIYDGAHPDDFRGDATPSDDEFASPKRKLRTDLTIKPALDGFTNLGVCSSGPEDGGEQLQFWR